MIPKPVVGLRVHVDGDSCRVEVNAPCGAQRPVTVIIIKKEDSFQVRVDGYQAPSGQCLRRLAELKEENKP